MKKLFLVLVGLFIANSVFSADVPGCWNQRGHERQYAIRVNVDKISKEDLIRILARTNDGVLKGKEYNFNSSNLVGQRTGLIIVEAFNFYAPGVLSENEFRSRVENQLYGILEINLHTHDKIDAFGAPIWMTCIGQ